MSPAAHLLVGLVRIYRFLRSAAAPCCRYTPSCSAYALEALQVHGACRGAWLAIRRSGVATLGSCGYDPVLRPSPRPD